MSREGNWEQFADALCRVSENNLVLINEPSMGEKLTALDYAILAYAKNSTMTNLEKIDYLLSCGAHPGPGLISSPNNVFTDPEHQDALNILPHRLTTKLSALYSALSPATEVSMSSSVSNFTTPSSSSSSSGSHISAPSR